MAGMIASINKELSINGGKPPSATKRSTSRATSVRWS
jgi:hypothetical protein